MKLIIARFLIRINILAPEISEIPVKQHESEDPFGNVFFL